MPCYEYECSVCGRFEKLLPLSEADSLTFVCQCGNMAERIHSLVTVRPDSMWSGVMTEHAGYVTSSSQHNRVLKDKGWMEIGDSRDDRESVHKIAADARKAKKEKFAKETRTFLETQFSGKGLIDSFGQLTPEARRPLSDKQILNGKDEGLKS